MHVTSGWRVEDLFELLEQLSKGPLTSGEVDSLAGWWEQLKPVKAEGVKLPNDCPRCGVQLEFARMAHHAERCPRHPLRLRCEQLQRLMPAAGLARVVTVKFPDEGPARELLAWYPPEAALKVLRGPPSDEHADAVRCLSETLHGKLRFSIRAADPCPWCRGVFELGAFDSHLQTCRKHPGGERSDVLEDQLRELLGEAAFTRALEVDRAQQLRAALDALVQACRTYADSMGWYETDRFYTKKWSELPWRRALTRAADVFKSLPRELLTDEKALGDHAALTCIEKASWSFWNGMGDDEDGRSIIHADDCRDWEAVVQLAADRLGG